MAKWINIFNLESTLGYKVLIAGLNEAGKTAIKKIFFEKQKSADVSNLKATINYSRMAIKISGISLTIIDLGGQKVFINRFLNKFSPFIFNNVKILIFLIDASQKSTRNNSIQYFKSCVNRIEEFSSDTDIYVFLNKVDLINQLPNYENIHKQLKEEFQSNSQKRIRFFRTSIYDQPSIINAFGRIIELSLPSASKSRFVEGRTIGKGEEYSEKFDGFKEEESLCPNCSKLLIDSPEGLKCSVCDFSVSEKEKETSKEMKITIEDLESQLQNAILNENTQENLESQEDDKSIKISEESQSTSSNSIKELSKYNLSFEETDQIVNYGFLEIFLLSLKFGVKLKLLKKIFTYYLPKVNLLDKVSPDTIFGIISSYINGIIQENEIFDIINKSVFFPSLTIDELIWNNFPVMSLDNAENEKISKDNLIKLPSEEKIYLKLNRKDNIVDLIFLENDSEFLRKSISLNINEVDLTYLFAFDLDLPVKSNLKEFVKQSVSLILNELQKLKSVNIEKTVSIKVAKTASKQIKLHKEFNIYYKFQLNEENVEILFSKQDKSIGKIIVPLTVTSPELYHEIRKKTLTTTIISEEELMYSVFDLYTNFEEFLSN